MTIKTNIHILALSLCLALCMGACHSSRKSVGSSETYSPTGEGKATTATQRVSLLVESYTIQNEWADFSAPVKCSLRAPKSISVSGRIHMVKDKSISLSLRMLGFEVAGLYIDSDSIFMYEKINKSLVAEPMTRLSEATGLTLSNIQDLLTGIICYPGKNIDVSNLSKLFNIIQEDNIIKLTPRDGKAWAYSLTDDSLPILISASATTTKASAVCKFGMPETSRYGIFIPTIDINADAGKYKLDASLIYNLPDIKTNTGVKSSRPSFKGYKRMPFDRLVKSLGAI